MRHSGDGQALTAYGGLATVPGEVDILSVNFVFLDPIDIELTLALFRIAGTSCVDYSGLNRQKKGISDGGESGARRYLDLFRVLRCL